MNSGILWILAASLCANGILLAARWRVTGAFGDTSGGVQHPAQTTEDPATGSSMAASEPHAGGGAVDPASSPAAATSPRGIWSKLNFSDLKSVVADLRASGLPEDDVRCIVGALIRDRFKARMEAAQLQDAGQPFWKTRSSGPELLKRYAESAAIWREIETLTAEVIGPESFDPLTARRMRQQFGPLPEAKIQALVRSDRDYNELAMQTRLGSLGPTMPWEREQLVFIESEKRRDLESLLTPDELEIYELHNSPTAHALRMKLAGMDASEAEFRTIFALQREVDLAFNHNLPGISSGDMAAQSKVQMELREKIRAALGEARFADYERANDQGYQTALAVTRRLKLPQENATAAYSLAQQMREGVKALNRRTELSAVDRSAAIGVLINDANTHLETLLTRSGAAAYKARSSTWRYVEGERGGP